MKVGCCVENRLDSPTPLFHHIRFARQRSWLRRGSVSLDAGDEPHRLDDGYNLQHQMLEW